MLSYTPIIPSTKLTLFVGILYALVALALMMNGMPVWLKLLWLILLLANGKKYVSRYVRLNHRMSVVAFSKPSSFWLLEMKNKEKVYAKLKANSLITHFLLVLNFEAEQSLHLTTLLTPESIGFQNFRRLLIYFSHGPAHLQD